ncbi:NAD(P)H-binding protein [Catenulispora yoronensis]|uniref:NAD(P)H-binding protein n=1 Tax=Catenulispora yoronensis TaxID=450799 RepID=A0ABP5H313_9ACTN
MFLITGATGNVGRNVVEQLAAAGHKVRALSRNPERAQWPAGVDAVAGDLADAASLGAALAGVEAVFLLAVPTASGADFVAAAEAAGVRRVVLLSSGSVDDDAETQSGPIAEYHWRAEQALRASDLEWTFLRGEVFAANTLPWGYQTKAGDDVRGAYAAAAGSPIHEVDIAEVAVAALTGADPAGQVGATSHAGRVYHLSGPESLTHADQARILGEVLDRPIRFVEVPVDAVREQMSAHVPAPILDDIIGIWAASVGNPRPVTDAVERVTGHPARSFATWVQDHAAAF